MRLLLALLLLVVSAPVFSQSSATASVAAEIVVPVTITKTQDLRFNNPKSGGRTRVSPIARAGANQPAVFMIGGEPAYILDFTIDQPAEINPNATSSMTMHSFTAARYHDTNGALLLCIGSTLNLKSTIASGKFESEPVRITLNYN